MNNKASLVKTPILKSKLSKSQRNLEKYLAAEESGSTFSLPMHNDGKDISRRLVSGKYSFLARFAACPQCSGDKKRRIKPAPIVTISFAVKKGCVKLQGVCAVHWVELAESDLGWTTEGVS